MIIVTGYGFVHCYSYMEIPKDKIMHCWDRRFQVCPVDRGGKMGKFSRAPRRLGVPFKNTEKSVPDGFFLASNMHKIHFWQGLRSGPHWGASVSRSRRIGNGVVIGPLAILVSRDPPWLSTGLQKCRCCCW